MRQLVPIPLYIVVNSVKYQYLNKAEMIYEPPNLTNSIIFDYISFK